jgi:hypothetical protein
MHLLRPPWQDQQDLGQCANHRDGECRFAADSLMPFEDALQAGPSTSPCSERGCLMVGAGLGGGGRSVVASTIVSA